MDKLIFEFDIIETETFVNKIVTLTKFDFMVIRKESGPDYIQFYIPKVSKVIWNFVEFMNKNYDDSIDRDSVWLSEIREIDG